MANGEIIGEGFASYVRNQVYTREKVAGKGINSEYSDSVIKYNNSKTSFIRLTSGVNVDGSAALATQYVLGGGTNFADTYAGVGYNNTSAYGFKSDKNYGYVPMPGIISAQIKSLNRGSLREATVEIKCHNLKQFNDLEKLFLRLKYSVLLEWGHTCYFKDENNFVENPNHNLSNYFLSPNTTKDILAKIEKEREASHGNYDAFFGFVKNYTWTLREDGGYDISLNLIAAGDVIESLKINTNFPKNDNPAGIDEANQEYNLPTYYKARYSSTLNRILDFLASQVNTSVAGAGKTFNAIGGKDSSADPLKIASSTGLKSNFTRNGSSFFTEQEAAGVQFSYLTNGWGGPSQTAESGTFTADQYYIKLGELLKIMESFLLLYDTSKGSNNERPPQFFIDYDYNKNLCFTTPHQASNNPKICLIDPSTKVSSGQNSNGGGGASVIPGGVQKAYLSFNVDTRGSGGVVITEYQDADETPGSGYGWINDGGSDLYINDSNTTITPLPNTPTTIKENQSWQPLWNNTPGNSFEVWKNKIKTVDNTGQSLDALGNNATPKFEQLLGSPVFRKYITGASYVFRGILDGTNANINNYVDIPFKADDWYLTNVTLTPKPLRIRSDIAPLYNSDPTKVIVINFSRKVDFKQIFDYNPYDTSAFPDNNFNDITTMYWKPDKYIKGDRGFDLKFYTLKNIIGDDLDGTYNWDKTRFNYGAAMEYEGYGAEEAAWKNLFDNQLKINSDEYQILFFPIDDWKEDTRPIQQLTWEFSKYTDGNFNPANFNQTPGQVFTDIKDLFREGVASEWAGKFMHVLVNLNFISETIQNNLDEEGNISVYDFLVAIMQGIQDSLGNINNFEVIYNESTNALRIIDNTMIPGINGDEITVFNTHLLNPNVGSFVNNVSIKSELSNKFATMVSVGAQANGNVVGSNSTMLSKWNDGYKDRHVESKANENLPTNQPSPESIYQQNLLAFNQFLAKTHKCFVTDNDISSASKIMDDILKYEVGRYTNNDSIKGIGFIPINLQLDIEGLSGIKIYQSYTIDDTLLPPSYKNKIQFIAKGVSHKIDSNGWTTSLESIVGPKQSGTVTKPPKKASWKEVEVTGNIVTANNSGNSNSKFSASSLNLKGPELEPIKSVIVKGESGGDYESIFPSTRYISEFGVSILTQTIQQVADNTKNRYYYGKDKKKSVSSRAVGKYQVLGENLLKIAKDAGLSPTDLYNEANQEKIGLQFILNNRKQLAAYILGTNDGDKLQLEKAVTDTGQCWTSKPTIKNKSGTVQGNVDIDGDASGRKGWAVSGINSGLKDINVATVVRALIRSRIQTSNKRPLYIPAYLLPEFP
jgi:hypothetical protein